MKLFLHRSILLFFSLVLIACAGSSPMEEATPTVTATFVSTNTPTSTPSYTPTPTPTPVLLLPVNQYTPPPPLAEEPINPGNLQHLVEFKRVEAYGMGRAYTLRTDDGNLIFIRDEMGLEIYDAASKDLIYQLTLAANPGDAYWGRTSITASHTGEWVVVDGKYLVHFVPGQQPSIETLDPGPWSRGYAIWTGIVNFDSKPFLVLGSNKLIDLTSNETVYQWGGAYQTMHGVTGFTRDGSIAVGQVDNRFFVWDVASGEVLGSATADRQEASGAISQLGKYLAVVTGNRFFVQEVASGELVLETAYDCWDSTVVFSPNESFVAVVPHSIKHECQVRVWSLSTGSELASGETPDGRQVRLGNSGIVQFVDHPREYEWWYNVAYYSGMGFASDNSVLVPSINANSRVYIHNKPPETIWKDNLGRDSAFIGLDGEYYRFQRDASQITIREGFAGNGREVFTRQYGGTHFWFEAIDLINQWLFYTIPGGGSERTSFIEHYGKGSTILRVAGRSISHVQFTQDGRLNSVCLSDISTATLDRLLIHETETGLRLFDIPVHCSLGRQIDLAFDGSMVVFENPDLDASELVVRQLGGEGERRTLRMDCEVTAVAFTHDTSLLAVACDDLTLRFYETTEFQEVHRMKTDMAIEWLDFSWDGVYMFILNNDSVGLWTVDADLSAIFESQRIFRP